MNNFARWITRGLTAIAVVLFARSFFVEGRTPFTTPARAGATFDPPSYYAAVNDEVAPHLEYCPLVAGVGPLAARATALDLDGADDPSDVEGRCGCSDRLGPLFCVRDDALLDEAQRDRLLRFVRMSPLLEDLHVPSRWTLERAAGAEARWEPRLRLGVHRRRLPGAERDVVYSGTVFFRASSERPVIIDEAGRRHVLDHEQPGADEHPLFPQALPTNHAAQRFHPRTLRLRDDTAIVELTALPTSRRQVLVVIRQSPDLRVMVDGVEAPVAAVRRIFALEQDQQLVIARGDRRTALRLSTGRSGVISELRHTSLGAARVSDPTSGVTDLVEGLTGAMAETLARLQQSRVERDWPSTEQLQALARTDVWLTLDAGIQDVAGRALRRYAESPASPINAGALTIAFRDGGWWRRGPRHPRESDRSPPPHFGLTVVDADKGEVLALGSYPDVPTARSLVDAVDGNDVPAELLRAHLRAELGRASLHLTEHVIGSLFKPLFAWSVGTSVPALLDFTTDASHDRGWRTHPRGNRALDQCLIDVRRVRDRALSHFETAYRGSTHHLSCAGATPAGREDLCMALAHSDTYFFLELLARTLKVSQDGSSNALPPRDASDRERDRAYALDSFCEAQREPVSRELLCASAQPRRGNGFPGTCENQRDNPLCAAMARLGVQHQSVTLGARTYDAQTFLGPLAAAVDAVTGTDAAATCPPVRERPLDAFRWTVPTRPQWSADALARCTPDLESFVEGGGVNYWNNLSLAQAFARLYTGDPELSLSVVGRAGAPSTDRAPSDRVSRRMQPIRDAAASDAVRAQVLEGLRLAVTSGTLAALRDVPAALARRDAPVTIDLRGKTGTIRSPYPVIEQRRDRRGRLRWVEGAAPRKSFLTALLLEVARGGVARHFVVLLWIEGLDDGGDVAASAIAGRFFQQNYGGFEVLRELVDFADNDLSTWTGGVR